MANESSIRAGKAFVELFADDSKLVKGLNAAAGKLKAFGNNVASIGKKMMLGGVGLVGSLFGASKVYADVGSKIKDMSDRTGMGAVAIQELAYAAEQSGTDMGALEVGVKKMQRAIVEAGQGVKGPVDALAAIGLSAQQLAGLAPDKQLALIGDRLLKINDPAEKAAAAIELFGRSGTMLLPMFEDLDALQKEFRKKGLGMSAEDVAAAEAYGDALSTLGKSFRAIVVAVGGAVAPMLKNFAAWAGKTAIAVRDWVKENNALFNGLLSVGAFLAVGGASLMAFGKAVAAIAAAFKVATTAAALFAAHPAIAALIATSIAVAAIVSAIPESKYAGKDMGTKEAVAQFDREKARRAAGKGHAEATRALQESETMEAARNAMQIEEDKTKAIAEFHKRIQDDERRMWIDSIEEKYAKEREAARQHYQAMYEEAKKLGEREAEITKRLFVGRLALIDQEEQTEKNTATKRRRDEAADQRAQLVGDIDRLAIENDANLTENQKAQALMALRHKQQREAFFAGPFGAGDDDLLLQRQKMEAKQLLMAQNALRQSTAGTFNAGMVGRMGGGNQLDRIAKATEGSKKTLDEINKKPAVALAFK